MGLGNIARFMKNRYVTPERDFVAEDYRHSDFGRMYGWWVLLDGIRVASLEYRCYLEEPVHMYAVTALHETFFRIDLDSDKWASPKLSIQSQYAMDYSQQGLQMAAVGEELIVVQNLYVPEHYYAKKHRSVTELHEKLLAKAEKNNGQDEHQQDSEAEEAGEKSSSSESTSAETSNPEDRIVG